MIRLPRRPGRYVLLLALAAAALVVPAAPATAAPVTDLNCTITVTTDAHPSVTAQLRLRSATSHGLTGTATCTGTVDGQPVTGPGRFALNLQAFGNCTQADGSATFVLKIPTTGGTKTIAGRYTFHLPGPAPTLTGDLTGTSAVVSRVGDCVTTPITRTTSVLTVHIP
jgi:hypothetical protein